MIIFNGIVETLLFKCLFFIIEISELKLEISQKHNVLQTQKSPVYKTLILIAGLHNYTGLPNMCAILSYTIDAGC